MRPHLNDRAANELISIMHHYEHTSPNHTLNIMISALYDSLFQIKSQSPLSEVDNNDQRSTNSR